MKAQRERIAVATLIHFERQPIGVNKGSRYAGITLRRVDDIVCELTRLFGHQ
ncbi:MAG: hypothetical protein U5O39_15010 [Gammaproteobacteria bacterium]|nr:hypothetical protein [Gammaproteobacteria bacterium]